MQLHGMAVEFPAVAGHPNRVPFEGVLTLVDVPSDKAPSGARGHRVVLTREAAEMALPSLLGMAVDKATFTGAAILLRTKAAYKNTSFRVVREGITACSTRTGMRKPVRRAPAMERMPLRRCVVNEGAR